MTTRPLSDARRLSLPIGHLRPHYALVVVGSGYGGAVVAARVAQTWRRTRPDARICVLERGRELQPGDYPDTPMAAAREMQFDLPSGRHFSPSALFDFRINPDISALIGCGLGGTSLINAGVALDPHDYEIFERQSWPAEIQAEAAKGELRRWVADATRLLGPAEYGVGGDGERSWEKLEKLWGLERVARAAETGQRASFRRAPVLVNLPGRDQSDDAQPRRLPCTGCGDCVSGCNYGAKNTLITNYLPMARRHGAEIFTETKVGRIERVGGRWRVHFELLGSGRERFGPPGLSITADKVVLAAGALGSTEILLRSRAIGVSDQLGCRFSGNGDVLALAYDTGEPVNGVGFGRRSPHGDRPPGPCISGIIQVRLPGGQIALVEDGVMPGALAPILSTALPATALFTGRLGRGRGWALGALLETLLRRGASTTQTFLAMFADHQHGQLVLADDRLRIVWPRAGQHAQYRALEDWLQKATTEVLRGTFVPSPFGLLTVHPLGGCVMADDAARGVVNHLGRVFAGSAGTAIHENLFVCDGSIIPMALGINPLLTIAALAERTATYVA